MRVWNASLTLFAVFLLPPIQVFATAGEDRFAAVDERLAELREELIEIRRDLHQHAESAGEEERTAGVVAEWLRERGLDVTTGVGGHGVVGILQGAHPGPVVAYRADMDAMATRAMDPEPFASKNPEVNHVCGHDVHTTVALGIAAALAPERDHLAGTVKFIFQPAEEVAQGARAMIEDGVMEEPAPEVFFALHTAPIPVGQMLLIDGMALPGLEMVEVTISGTGDLEASAKSAVEVFFTLNTLSAPMGGELQKLTVPPGTSYAVSNVIGVEPGPDPDSLILKGFIKASDDEAYATAREKVRAGLSGLASPDVSFDVITGIEGLPPMVNDVDLGSRSLKAARGVLGEENVLRSEGSIPFFGEDFAFFQERVPGVMYFLGVANAEKGIVGLPHAPNFRADEDAILVGARAMSAVVLDFLTSE